MEKQPPSAKEIFETLAQKYGSGERRTMEIKGYRNTCEVATVKLFPDRNGLEKNRAALFYNEDDNGYAIVFCHGEPKSDKECRKLIEIVPSGRSGEPNASFGEQGCVMNRVIRFRSDHDEFNIMAREMAFKMLIDINASVSAPIPTPS